MDMRAAMMIAEGLNDSHDPALYPQTDFATKPGDFASIRYFHGTASRRPGHFYPLAYFTPDFKAAATYANDDSEVEGGTPTVVEVRLHVAKVAALPVRLVQDMAQIEGVRGRELEVEIRRQIRAEGFDAAEAEDSAHEIVVFDPAKIEVVAIHRVPSGRFRFRPEDCPS